MSNNVQLYDLVNPKLSDDVLTELVEIFELCRFDPDAASSVSDVHADIVDIFSGDHPDFKASNAKYHNLEHTCSVVLSTARLLHGCVVKNFANIEQKDFVLGVIASYFHDTGLLQEKGDNDGTGAKYTIGHEQRSINFLSQYLSQKDYPSESIKLCADAIRATNLSLAPSKIEFSSIHAEVVGRIVGSADLIAQIADRAYLEKLRLLFLEFQEARLPGFDTQLDLLKQTEDFYSRTAKKRLNEDFGGIHRHMTAHFVEKWGIEKNLYEVAVQANITYIHNLVETCKDNYDCYMENLRRTLD